MNFISEIENCKSLKDLCLLREKLTALIDKGHGDNSVLKSEWKRAIFYEGMVSDQIRQLTKNGVFLATMGDAPSPTDPKP